MSVKDIRSKAKEAAQNEAYGATLLSIIKRARVYYDNGRECEQAGDLRNAYGSFIKAATLARIAIDSTESDCGGNLQDIGDLIALCIAPLARE
jgi:ubiquitin carboxyl-terminal hydrolase 8